MPGGVKGQGRRHHPSFTMSQNKEGSRPGKQNKKPDDAASLHACNTALSSQQTTIERELVDQLYAGQILMDCGYEIAWPCPRCCPRSRTASKGRLTGRLLVNAHHREITVQLVPGARGISDLDKQASRSTTS